MSNAAMTRAWVEIDLDAVRANYDSVRSVVGRDRALIAMIKADGYGLGAGRIVRALEPLEPWAYGVASAEEGVALREFGVARRILVFSPLTRDAIELAAATGLTLCVSDLSSLEQWARAARRQGALDFHVEIDTGMGRAGFDWRETASWAPKVASLADDVVRWTGVYTHFHGADSPDPAPTTTQWARFGDALAQLPRPVETLVVHACNSAAALRWPRFAADAVRPGIFLYGGDPGAHLDGERLPSPTPVASLRARIALIREVPPGSTVGYGATHVAMGWERWATLGIGYGDGLPRRLGNLGSGLVHGRRVRFVGRISMDMVVVDITDVPEAKPGDVVTLIGRDGAAEITLDEVAAQAETISYEILTGFTPRLPRVERERERSE
jgi:alanine racemase